jgi:hypothetical protein
VVPDGVQYGGLGTEVEVITSPPRQLGSLGLQVDYAGPAGDIFSVTLGGNLGLSAAVGSGRGKALGGTLTLRGEASNEPPPEPLRHLPTYVVEIAWSRTLTGIITLDTSTVEGTDVLGGFSGATGTTFDVVTPDVKSARVSRGRDSDLSVMQQGTCTLRLKDPDGRYNPLNPGSPMSGMLVPMRPVRVRAVHRGIHYGLFRGFITSIEHNPARDAQESIIECGDLFVWLSRFRPIIASTGPTTVGTAIGLILDQMGWSDPSFRSLDEGSDIADFSADGEDTAIDVIAGMLQIDLGDFFIDGDGVATYRDTGSRYGAADVVTLAPTVVSRAKPTVDVARVRNTWTVTRTGGVTQVATDTTSKDDYGPRDAQPITSPYFISDTQAGALASFLLFLYKDPQSPTQSLSLWNRDDSTIVKQLDTELGAHLRFTEGLGGTVIVGTVEHLDHEIWEAGRLHRVDLLMRAQSMSSFKIDVSSLDGDDVLVY